MTVAESAKQTRARPVAVGLAVFLTLYAALVVAIWLEPYVPQSLGRLLALAFMVLMGPFLVLIHECGHYVVGRLVGWRIALFCWGGYVVRIKPWRVSRGAPPLGSGVGGAVFAVPVEGKEERWRWIAIFAGGPGANLILAALFGAAVYAAPPGSAARALYMLPAIFSLIIGLTNLWPQKGRSDGAQIARLLLKPDTERRALLARLVEQVISDVRPRDWPPALAQAALRYSLWSAGGEAFFVYAWHMDRGEIEKARAVLERIGASCEVRAERAFFAAYIDGDAVKAASLLADDRVRACQNTLSFWRAEAALAVLVNDGLRAHEAIRKGRLLAIGSPFSTICDRQIFDELERRLHTSPTLIPDTSQSG